MRTGKFRKTAACLAGVFALSLSLIAAVFAGNQTSVAVIDAPVGVQSNASGISLDYCTVEGIEDKAYTGQPVTQDKLVVKYRDNELTPDVDYEVVYSNNTEPGTATLVIKGKRYYIFGEYTATFKIIKPAAGGTGETAGTEKLDNPVTVKTKTVKISYQKLKKKNQTVPAKKAFMVADAKGSITYRKISGPKKIKITSAGKIKVGKGLKKGNYKVKVLVTAAGDDTHKAAEKNVTVKVRVK